MEVFVDKGRCVRVERERKRHVVLYVVVGEGEQIRRLQASRPGQVDTDTDRGEVLHADRRPNKNKDSDRQLRDDAARFGLAFARDAASAMSFRGSRTTSRHTLLWAILRMSLRFFSVIPVARY